MLEFVYSARRAASRSASRIGWLGLQVIRRQSDVALSIFVTVITAYAAYIVAEELHVSGVLAAVVERHLRRLERALGARRRDAPLRPSRSGA